MNTMPHVRSHRLLSLMLLAALWSVHAVSQALSLHGRIVDYSTNRGVDRAAVRILESGRRAETDSTGAFSFTALPAGRYTVSVHHLAYAAVERSVVFSPDGTGAVSGECVIGMHSVLLQADEVIVRSTRTSSSANTTPFPVERVTRESSSLQRAATVSDAIATTPGAFLVRDGAWATAVSIRGMSRSNIVMLVDDTRIETANDIAGALSLVDRNDIDRVEVLKSPGSSLYGSGALGGVVHMVTKRPSFTEDGGPSVEVTEGATSVDGGIAHHLAVEHSGASHALRISGGYRKAGATMTPEGTLPNSQYADFTLAGTFGVRTFGSQSLFLTYQRVQAEDTGIPGGAPIAASASARYLLARRELFSLEYAMPNISSVIPLITFRLSRQEIDRNVEILQSPDVTLTPHATHLMMSAQAEVKLAVGTTDMLTLGADLWQRDLDSKRERMYTSIDLLIGERPVPLSSYFSAGAYAHNEWHLAADRVTLALGARYDLIRVSNEDGYNYEYRITSSIDDARHERLLLWKKQTSHDESWSANAGAVYALTESVKLSCLAAAAYRSPSLEERYQFIDLGSVVRVGDPSLRPERSMSVNAGLSLHTDGFTMRTDVFVNSLTDLITELPGTFESRAALIKTNIGEARLYGFEIANEHMLARWAALSYQLSYVRGEDVRSHTSLPQIAPLNGRAALTMLLAGAGTIDVSATYAFDQHQTAAGEPSTPGYATVDAGFSSEQFTLGRAAFGLRVGVQNIFDKAYRTHLSTLRGTFRLEPGRNVYLSLTVGV